MKSSEMISTIKYVEKHCHGINQMYISRISIFQTENLPETVAVEYDAEFDVLVKELEAVMECKVYKPTAKKILNNWYIWAKNNLNAVRKIKPFVHTSDPIDWLILNRFRIDHASFVRDVEEESINKIRDKMPKDSDLYKQLKTVADNKYPSKRGSTYNYLVKVAAGFSEVWA